MKRLRQLASSLCLSIVVGVVAVLGAGCGKSDTFDPEPLLVPWDQLSGRIAYIRGPEVIVIDSAARTVRRVYKISDLNHWVMDVAWHPSGNSLAVTIFMLDPRVWSLASIDVRTGTRTDLYPTIFDPKPSSYSADGRLAFFGGPPAYPGIYIDGVLGLVFPPIYVPETWSAPAWSPDGLTLAVAATDPLSGASSQPHLYLVDVSTWTTSPFGPTNCTNPTYSSDGTRIAYTSMSPELNTEQLWFASVPGGVETHLSAADSILPAHAAWSPDGSRLLVHSNVAVENPKLFLVDAATGAPTQLTSKDGHSPAWIP